MRSLKTTQLRMKLLKNKQRLKAKKIGQYIRDLFLNLQLQQQYPNKHQRI